MPAIPPRQWTPRRQPGSYVGAIILASLAFIFFESGGTNAVTIALGLASSALGSLAAFRTWRLRRRAHATDALTASYQAIAAGQFAFAESFIAEATARYTAGWVDRNAAIQRALIEMRRGDAEKAATALDRAIAIPRQRSDPAGTDYQIEGAHALKAFACASLGRRDEALAEIAIVRGSASASVDALAKASLAEAILLERAGEREALRALLERDREILLENTHPRERAIIRAYQRMLKVASSSVYRHARPTVDEDATREEPGLADWVAKIAPAAAPFVRVARRSGGQGEDLAGRQLAVNEISMWAVREQRSQAAAAARTKTPFARKLATASAGVFGVAAILAGVEWLYGGGGGGHGGGDLVGAYVLATPLAILAGVAISFATAWAIRRSLSLRAERALEKARRTPGAVQGLTTSEDGVVAAQALTMLASREEKAGAFDQVAITTSRAIGRLLADMKGAARSGLLFPDLVGLHAFALAAVGNFDQANAELASLPDAYPHRGRAVYRVTLVTMVRRGEWREAAEFVEKHALDLPLSVREELLGDLVRAVAAPEHAGLGELDRLREELRVFPENRRWIDVVAPGLVGAFNGEDAPPRLRIDASGATEIDPVVERERVAEAEVEADALLAELHARADGERAR